MLVPEEPRVSRTEGLALPSPGAGAAGRHRGQLGSQADLSGKPSPACPVQRPLESHVSELQPP